MSKKISISAAAAIAGATAVITFATTTFWAFQIRNDSVAELKKKSQSINEIYAVDEYIDRYYYGEYDERDVIDDTLKAMVSALDDKYSEYMTPREYDQSLVNAKGTVSGIGIVVNLTEKNEIKIVKVNDDSPAKNAGLKQSDIIIAVDGQDVSEIEYKEAVNLVRGVLGTDVTITIKRGSEILDFTMTRDEVLSVHQSVTSRMLENDIAYIRINSFKENTSGQFNDALDECLEKGAKALIFDLRNNGGGLVSACEDCLDPLLPEGDIAIAEFKDGTSEVICKSDKAELNIPMAVLVNEKTASAAELFSASLRDFDKAVLVGKNTFGKGIMQNTFNLKSGGGLRLTVAKYRTVKSECYHKIGLAPDYEVEMPEEYTDTKIEDIPESDDAQLQKAIEKLK